MFGDDHEDAHIVVVSSYFLHLSPTVARLMRSLTTPAREWEHGDPST